VVEFERGDFVKRRRYAFLQKINGAFVKGRTEERESVTGGPFGEGCVPFPGSHGLGVKFTQVLSCPEAFLEKEAVVPALYGDGLGFVGLELDRIGPGFRSLVNELDGFVKVASVVAREFGHDEWW
jgi:hypothetical protein